ncbi:polyadenylate-binding protein, putative, partial [Ichthyophthirius multifiliis]
SLPRSQISNFKSIKEETTFTIDSQQNQSNKNQTQNKVVYEITDISELRAENSNELEKNLNKSFEEDIKIIPHKGIEIDDQEFPPLNVQNELIQKKVARIAMSSKTQKKPDSQKNKRQLLLEKEEEKQKQKLMRKSAGEVWVDSSMNQWPDSDYRIFCGNLGNEVTDDVLANSFKKYPSFCKARVVRDKRSQKTQGYGFVSFLDPQDFLKALKEMQGKYIGNRPVKLQKSEWEKRSFSSKKDDDLGNKFLKKGLKKTKISNKF